MEPKLETAVDRRKGPDGLGLQNYGGQKSVLQIPEILSKLKCPMSEIC